MSRIRIFSNVPLDPRYEHSILWQSESRQLDYFSGDPTVETVKATVAGEFSDFTYLRKESAVKVPMALEDMENAMVNYVAILNDGADWRYYFVRNKEYVSPSVTRLDIELDVIQTYQFDWEIPACFVEREHTNTDTAGDHLIDEGLELGEYVASGGTLIQELKDLAIVVQSSVTLQNPMGGPVSGKIISGVYSGLALYCRSCNALGATVLNAAISALSAAGKADGITSIFVYPKVLIDADWANETNEVMLEVNGIQTGQYTVTKQTTLDGYTPRNKKLLTYPYNFLYVHNNAGEAATLKYEYFSTDNCVMSFGGSIAQDGVVRMTPDNYRGYAHDNESGLSLTGFPACAWTQDAYKIWLAQNSNSQALAIQGGQWTMGMGAVQTAAGVVDAVTLKGTGNLVGGVDTIHSGYMQIQSVMAARSDKAVQPPQAKGTQSPSCNISMGLQSYTITKMTISAYYAQIIDQYFDMYGYRVNAVKVPNLKGRPMWNYVKTIGCNVLGGIDASDRRLIGAIFDKGITLWHAPEVMYKYNLAAGNVAV